MVVVLLLRLNPSRCSVRYCRMLLMLPSCVWLLDAAMLLGDSLSAVNDTP